MDSSRNSLLSTLLMTLPLIVVPLIAMLRPPGPTGGISTAPMAASETPWLNDFDGLFEEEFASENATDTPAESDPSWKINADPFLPGAASAAAPEATAPETTAPETTAPETPVLRPTAAAAEAEPAPVDQIQLAEQRLRTLGASRVHWFEASAEKPFGLSVFFRGSDQIVQYGFMAAAPTRIEALTEVLDQVAEWQKQREASSIRPVGSPPGQR
ncbi:MAG: hypothetical protein ACO3FE_08740 [Planctomycetaceae bacterium]